MVEFTRRTLMASSVAAAVGAGTVGLAGATDDPEEHDTLEAPYVEGNIDRFSTTAFGAEVTGPFVFDTGELLYSLQGPHDGNVEPFDTGGVGVFDDFQFTFNGANDEFEELEPPQTDLEEQQVLAAAGEYRLLVQTGDEINGGTERFGHPQTPDGTELVEICEDEYEGIGEQADMNFFVPTNEEGTEGYLFTNNEIRPGAITRTPLYRDEDGYWQADLENAMELENTEPFREIGGTKINCYGDLSPWETPLSAEEEYGHPRVNGLATVGDIVERGSGVGLRGGSEFWNRPNILEVDDALEELFGDEHAYPMGLHNNRNTEKMAYHLGVEPVDQEDVEDEDGTRTVNTPHPIGDEAFPNRYRYGKIVEITEPTAEVPTPVKHHVFGRAAWECPEVLPDEKTVYLASDGGAKGIYKFVAEEPIPEYDDRMDVRGTLYAMKATEIGEGPVAETDLDIEWLPLGTASNAEVESWISDYDDVTQVDYLETHAETDWTEDLEQALQEADEAVAIDGNQDYITDEEIVEWAEQYEEYGPDGVDEELRRVPFLETRAAAKEIGASIEFNKAEGIDAHDEAEPGDFIYFGISSLGGSMADEHGDLRFDEVQTGVLYRAELEAEYDVSRLEPVVVGPNESDPESVLDESLINVDNVMVMDDGRVLLCEDKDSFGRSYPNDALWVYEPPTTIHVDSLAVSYDGTGEVDLTLSSLPDGLAGGRVSVSVDHPGVARIVDADYHDGLELTSDPSIGDGSSVEFRFADIEDEIGTGRQVTLATIELEGVETGTTDLSIDVHALDDDTGASIEPDPRPGIVVTGPPPIGGGPGGSPPQDLDGDGKFEDVNGNGRFDYDDVVTLFEHIEDESVTLNEDAFDFNENGRIDYDDPVALYEMQ
ncbi:alkaline phosphatase PhoX [Halopiger goleimassiliensis]|uniref:alkaline phosphatase PhoX n=1 Tax=Halopiger goleimassiliensis TaxID=1293048 RepID=UPI0006780CE0|nr:alkaline phosphatase PhoX [Halopiger goleimassiliensis]